MDEMEEIRAEDSRTIDEMIRDLLRATGQRREREADKFWRRAISQFGLDEEAASAFVDDIMSEGGPNENYSSSPTDHLPGIPEAHGR